MTTLISTTLYLILSINYLLAWHFSASPDHRVVSRCYVASAVVHLLLALEHGWF